MIYIPSENNHDPSHDGYYKYIFNKRTHILLLIFVGVFSKSYDWIKVSFIAKVSSYA